jgi:hypothetical protein
LVGGGDGVTDYSLTMNGERTLVSSEAALTALVTGIALGLGVSAEEARKRGQQARRGVTAAPIHHQWIAGETWVRIDQGWSA